MHVSGGEKCPQTCRASLAPTKNLEHDNLCQARGKHKIAPQGPHSPTNKTMYLARCRGKRSNVSKMPLMSLKCNSRAPALYDAMTAIATQERATPKTSIMT